MAAPRQPSWLAQAVFYQVYPQSFADGNGDGIGDLPGLIGRLDYLRSLGVDALWLNPIHPSPFGDAGYDVEDFLTVAPRYGTDADADRLFREAHARGMRVVMDLVAGHTSDRHPWFRAAADDPRAATAGWYLFTGDEVQSSVYGGGPCRVPGRRGGHYQCNFLPMQPALNYGCADPDPARPWQVPPDHPDCLRVRTALQGVMQHWLERGCDGFRVDQANTLIKGDKDGTHLARLWQGFRAWLDRSWPEAVLISEWSDPTKAIRAGFHADFMIHFGDRAYLDLLGPFHALAGDGRRPHIFFERAGEGDITRFLKPYLGHLQATAGRGYIALPTGNHDFHRPSRGRDARDLRVVHAMLLTMPGLPFIYYGDEIGLRHRDGLPEVEGSMWRQACRTPMQWDPGLPNLGFSTADPAALYLPVDAAPDAPTVADQERDPGSLLHLVRRLVALRRAEPSLGNDGGFRSLRAEPAGGPFIYERRHGGARTAVAVHPAAAPWRGPVPALAGAEPLLAEGMALAGTELAAQGVSFAVWRLPPSP